MRLVPAAFFVIGATQVLAQVPESYAIRVLVGDTRSGGATRLATDVALPGPAALAELGDGSLLIGGGNPHFGIGFTDTRVEALRRVTPDGRLQIAGRLLALSQSYGGVAVEPDGSLLYVDGCVIYRLPAWNSTSQGEVVAGIPRQSCLEEGDPTGRPATGATFSFIRTIARSSRGEIVFSTDAGSLIRMGQDGRLTLLSRGQFATAITGVAFGENRSIYVTSGCAVHRYNAESGWSLIAGRSSSSAAAAAAECLPDDSDLERSAIAGALPRVSKLAYDEANAALFVASARRVYRFDQTDGSVKTVAGQEGLLEPTALLVSARSGLLIGDAYAGRVYRLREGGLLETVAGRQPQRTEYPDALAYSPLQPGNVAALGGGSFVFGEIGSGRVLRYDPPGKLTALAGALNPRALLLATSSDGPIEDGQKALDISLLRLARLVQGKGEILLDQMINSNTVRVVRVGTDGRVTVPVPSATVSTRNVAADKTGSLYVMDRAQVSRLDEGSLTPNRLGFCMSGESGPSAYGSLSFDSRGNMYSLEFGSLVNGRLSYNIGIVKCTPDFQATVLIGGGNRDFSADVRGQQASLYRFNAFEPTIIRSLAVDSFDNLVWSTDEGVYAMAADGELRVLLGNAGGGVNVGDVAPRFAGVSAGEDGKLYVTLPLGTVDDPTARILELAPIRQ